MKIKALFYYLIAPVLLISLLLSVGVGAALGTNGGKVTLNRQITSAVFNGYQYKKMLLFFGYVGCTEVCAPKLEELAAIYEKIEAKLRPEVGVLFVNLSTLEEPHAAQLFAEAFHPDFQALYLDKELLAPLQREFQVYMAPSLTQKGEYDHTAFVYLLEKAERGYKLNAIYTDTLLSQNQILADIKSTHVN